MGSKSKPKYQCASLAEQGVHALLRQLGIADEPGTLETPKRVVKAMMEFAKGEPNWEEVFTVFEHKGSKNGFSGMVVQTNIPFRCLCEHHLMPATGFATLGYIPNKHVVGLSKLARVVDAVGTIRPSLQEYVCDKICDVLEERLDPVGVMCVITATHACMHCRGVNKPGVDTVTSSLRGAFIHVPAARQEFFELARFHSSKP